MHDVAASMPRYLEYRAGPRALARMRDGFSAADVRTLIAPATGPKWLVSAGFDRALVRGGVLAHGAPVLLAGASAGAWRAIVMSCRDPLAAHERLLEEYVTKVFTRAHTPEQIGDDYRATLARVISRADAEHALSHPYLRARAARGARQGLGRRARRGAEARARRGRGRARVRAATRRCSSSRRCSRRRTCRAQWLARAGTRHAELTADNLHDVALASGSVPMYMAPVALARRRRRALPRRRAQRLPRAQVARRRRRRSRCSSVTSAASFRRGSTSTFRGARRRAHVTDNLLLVYPSAEFLELLPDRQVPSREDFTRFLARPAERIARWRRRSRRANGWASSSWRTSRAGRSRRWYGELRAFYVPSRARDRDRDRDRDRSR